MRFLITLFVLLGLVACQNQEEESLPKQKSESPIVEVQDSDPVPKQKLNNREQANHLAKVANEVPDVNNATSLVAGPYVVVAIDVDKDLDRSRVGSIKYSVAEAMKKDPYGKNAVVIADADGYERIKQMARKVREGQTVQGITDELAAIVGRYMPEVPVPEQKLSEPDQNKKTIPKKQKQELDNIEDEQSNHYK
ncbi:YhcN/YlaJ family sporulation lipoprotein [Pontibacillus yanchengensis]|uniref:YhcN/YlaJ family sporulation lipoprotein n=3 Tax=Pontibacillus yanchengensis TaxID=462910 RepID=A0ACC7VD67_9BACI|nr:YhcN/YlaJ family sporulation lipoprotein [Pontibacillus yanchengensis]MYL32994.1 YhcN/YlaJ family sporulation lipoprotein [Pontibacillus yanchengensis]MYL52156.1 YhcN/YlaJ family sporulation lipoprotein [Pontibacillus yanchengensis]